ncbi:MAG: hypothetical protein U9R58_14010, partial [Chloroflexota bacterium]|nr:hypothetical protein [Chloroflexota bacterium]
MNKGLLLIVDGIVNLVLGILLLIFPRGIVAALGAPVSTSKFYPSILGAVLFGIGLALLMEHFGSDRGIRGLGLGGAIVINLCGAITLAFWLLSGKLQIPTRGNIVLWTIAGIVLVIGLVEISSGT